MKSGRPRKKPVSTDSLTEIVTRTMTSRGYATQSEFASAIATSSAYLSDIMSGNRTPTDKWVDIVAENTGMSAEEKRGLYYAVAKRRSPGLPDLDLSQSSSRRRGGK